MCFSTRGPPAVGCWAEHSSSCCTSSQVQHVRCNQPGSSKRLEASHSSPECLPSLGYLASTQTPMILCGPTPAVASFLWISGFPFPQLVSTLLHYLSAQNRCRLSPLDFTSAAGKQTTIWIILQHPSSRSPHIAVSLRTRVPVILCINKPHLSDSSSPESFFCMRVRNIPKTMTPTF
ncbi:hypothetical protein ATANTOWER_004562 [Ataeniobius toweri]|uniref:Uncharacterized protein n=1 Tax=Ataeniobius toweri TaxID=208326 RepID=A0ABU7BGB2_9TELE|nr:hypothetical protein [Ataeniobius toweri]